MTVAEQGRKRWQGGGNCGTGKSVWYLPSMSSLLSFVGGKVKTRIFLLLWASWSLTSVEVHLLCLTSMDLETFGMFWKVALCQVLNLEKCLYSHHSKGSTYPATGSKETDLDRLEKMLHCEALFSQARLDMGHPPSIISFLAVKLNTNVIIFMQNISNINPERPLHSFQVWQ